MACNNDCDVTDVYLNNDHVLTLDNLQYNGTSQNTSTVTFQIYDCDGTAVSGANGTLTAVGSGGDYTVTIDKATINLLIEGQEYYIRITGVESGVDFEFNLLIRVKRRGKT